MVLDVGACIVHVRSVNLELLDVCVAQFVADFPSDGEGSADAVALGQTLDVEKKLATVLRLAAAGYLSKGYAQFSASPLKDATDPAVKAKLRDLHPQRDCPSADVMKDEETQRPYQLTREKFKKIVARLPRERGMGVDALSYEEIMAMYHTGGARRELLYRLLYKIGSGSLHSACAGALGGNLLYGLCKPDGGTRPIGVGGALRRLVGRIAMADLGEDMARVFTETKPSAEQLIRHGYMYAGDHPCLTPVQVGVAIKGGAEIAIALARLVLHKHRSWAMIADDKKNGFNAVSRESIFKGLRQWFPQLIPLARFFYSRQGELYTCDAKGRRAAVDEVGEYYFSAEGCTQGDSLGPFLFAIGYHYALLETQAAHPDTVIVAYLDDTYYLQEPTAAL